MKRLLAFILVVAMALAFAGSASAFSWEKPAQPTPEEIGYSIDVLKCTLVTGAAGSYYYNVDDAAVAVNGADVYWAVKLTVDGPSDLIQSTAFADVEISGLGLTSVKDIPLNGLDDGVYYFIPSAGGYFQKIETILANGVHSPVQATRCTDTQTARVTARVYSERMMEDAFNVGDYDVRVRPLLNQANILTYIEDYEENYQKGEKGGWSSENSVIMRQDDPENGIYYIDTKYDKVKEALATHWTPPLYEEDKVKQALEENFLAVYKENNPSQNEWDPAMQFRIAGSTSGFTLSTSDLREHIFVIGGYPIILKLANGAYKPEDIAKMLYEKLQSKLGELRNANGQPIPGLTVSLEETPYTTTCCYIVFGSEDNNYSNTRENTSYVFTFSADSSYNWDTPGNNIVAQKEYKTYYYADESEQLMLVTFYQAASQVGSGPAIAQFVLNGDRQVQAVLTSEAAWKEYFDKANVEQSGNAWYAQCPKFLGDMDAIFDLMAWLDEGEIDSIYEAIEAGEMYMTDENLWEALGYAYRFEDSVSWQASTVPIIVDPLA